MPDPNNPLSYIGQSNDPSLKDRAIGTNTALQNLRGGLAQIASQSGYDRQLEAQKGRQARNLEELKGRQAVEKELYKMHIDPSNWPKAMEKLKGLYTSGLLNTGTDIVSGMRESGLFKEYDPGVSALDFLTQFDRPMFEAAPVPGAATGDVTTIINRTGGLDRRQGIQLPSQRERDEGFQGPITVTGETTDQQTDQRKGTTGVESNNLAWASEPTKKFRVTDSGTINTVRNAVRNVGENQKFANEVYEDKTHYYIFNHTDNKTYSAPKSGMPGMEQVE